MSLRGSMRKRLKNSGDRNRKKKRRNLARKYLGNLQPNYFMDGDKKGMRRKGKKNRRKIGVNRKIPWDKES